MTWLKWKKKKLKPGPVLPPGARASETEEGAKESATNGEKVLCAKL